jgi:SAM-dependent methyltransferase
MAEREVDYDQIAPTYDQRYTAHAYDGVGAALLSLVEKVGGGRILEVGCGTGHWLTTLRPVARSVYGLDLSLGMLQRGQQQQRDCPLICGRASHLPFAGAAFDLVFCVNAFHHFAHPHSFIAEARRLLRAAGALAIIGMDPHSGRDRWCVYDYFPETREIDLARFPSGGTIVDWMVAAGFDGVEWRVAERIIQPHVGRSVLESPILQKHGTSQLALLTDEAYAAGMDRLKAAVRKAEASGESLVFPVDVSLTIVTGYVRAG